MLSRGTIKPDRINAGIIIKEAMYIACIWLVEIFEMSTPNPREPKRNIKLSPKRSGMLPATGTPNQNIPTPTVSATLTSATATKGKILPSISSHDLIGVTINCSKVPCSLSLTIAKAVSNKDWICRMIATKPGIQKSILFMLGLYKKRIRASIGSLKSTPPIRLLSFQ